MELFSYLLKASAGLVVFFALYLLVLQKLTFFKFNRFYLLGTLILSFVIPTLHFTIEREVAPTTSGVVSVASSIDMENLQAAHMEQIVDVPKVSQPVKVIEQQTNWLALLPYTYGVIAASLLLIGIRKLLVLLRYTQQSAKSIDGLKLLEKTEGFTNCSFFNYVFINGSNLAPQELAALLNHERVHAQQYHSVDKIIMMMAKAIMWLNPVIYLWDKALEQTHEYEADEATANHFGSKDYASLLLKLAVSENQTALVHNFVKSPVKERIKMLFNAKSKKMKKLMYLLVVPIILGITWGFTVERVDVVPSKANEPALVLVLDAGHGGNQNGAVVNGYAEKDLTFSITKKIEAIAQAAGIEVVLTRSGDNEVSLKERASKEGHLLVSVHLNSEPSTQNGKLNGIEVFTSANDKKDNLQNNKLANHMLKAFKGLNGIGVNSVPQSKSLVLLRESKMPSVVLELGYLTNKKDFDFITNNDNQQKLAKSVVNGIVAYRNSVDFKASNQNRDLQDDPLIGKTIKGRVDSISKQGFLRILYLKVGNTTYPIRHDIPYKIKAGDELTVTISGKIQKLSIKDVAKNEELIYDAPIYMVNAAATPTGQSLMKAPEKHAFLYEANKARFAYSNIKSIKKNPAGYVNQIELNDGTFKILLNVSALKTKTVNFKTGDAVTVKFIGEKLISKNVYTTDKLIALYSNPKKYELVDPILYAKFYTKEGFQKVAGGPQKPLKITPISEEKVKVVWAEHAIGNVSSGVSYLTKAKLQIGKIMIEADDASLDSKNGFMHAKNAKVHFADGKVKVYKSVIYNINKKTYDFYEFASNKEQSSVISGARKEGALFFSKDVTLSKIEWSASDSVKVRRVFDDVVLTGKARVALEKYKAEGKLIHVDNANKKMVIYFGSLKDNADLKIEAEVIEVDLLANRYSTKKYTKE